MLVGKPLGKPGDGGFGAARRAVHRRLFQRSEPKPLLGSGGMSWGALGGAGVAVTER
ncbi:hypothetical protein G3H90_04420, partial [Xylella fastidiosa subsp. fastidiosa]|nr:hypothetical protein [Xylella fastidiosa subsp. fastidiosa]